jgi:hypothetical protein
MKHWGGFILKAVLVVGVLLLTWRLVVEVVEPHLFLKVKAWLSSGPAPFETQAAGGTRLRLYPDRRPHIGKISGLRKGLIWVKGRRELVEEGYGFGVPIVFFEGLAYVSRNAETTEFKNENETEWICRYKMDTIDTPIKFLRRKYRPIPPRGEVLFRYRLREAGLIDVTADFSRLGPDWEKVYIMNEQGAETFVLYQDSTGTRKTSRTLSIWSPAFVESACFSSRDEKLGFCLRFDQVTKIFYGRERYYQHNWRGIYTLSWSGVDIELDAPRSGFHYQITLEAER